MPAAKKPAARKPAAKKPMRTVKKVSPLKNTSVADFAGALSGWQSQAVANLAALVSAEAADSSAAIKWAQPVFDIGGPFVFIKPAAKHITIGFWRGAELADPDKLLDGSGDRMRHLKLTSAEHLDKHRPAIITFVRQAAQLNREKGDPTKR